MASKGKCFGGLRILLTFRWPELAIERSFLLIESHQELRSFAWTLLRDFNLIKNRCYVFPSGSKWCSGISKQLALVRHNLN